MGQNSGIGGNPNGSCIDWPPKGVGGVLNECRSSAQKLGVDLTET
jgi:hypothetical protein